MGGRGALIVQSQRLLIITWLEEAIANGARQKSACQIVQISVRTFQRWKSLDEVPEDGRLTRDFIPANKLSSEQRQQVIDVANSEEFTNCSPHQIVPILADRGEYIACESTFYRILRDEKLLAHRHSSRPARHVKRPDELIATAPNQVYSWDITYLASNVKGLFFYLYLFIDIFSRKIVGWQVYDEQSSEHAAAVIRDIHENEKLAEGQVVLHSDNGSPMKGATLLGMLQNLGIAPSFSRPSVSNDNAYSESLFKVLKYRPDYPGKPFETIEAARAWVGEFVDWYNNQHRHSRIRFVTPAQRHNGEDRAILEQRQHVYRHAKQQHPERWSGEIRNWNPIDSVALNPIQSHGKIAVAG